MERLIKFVAPTGKFDFVVKLCIALIICGCLNHIRHLAFHGVPGGKSLLINIRDATFTALPMSAFALMLLGRLRTLQKELYEQATTDSMTGLPNRRCFMENTHESIKPTQAIAIVDVDHFKAINDKFGHDVGDQCLRQLAVFLRATLGDKILCARIGGEEFALFVDNVEHDELRERLKRLSSGVLFETGEGKMRRVTVSIGLSLPFVEQTREQALRLADQALYQAKAKGRACCVALSG